MHKTGSRIIIEILQRQGVDTVFGYPGGAIMPLYDALYDTPIRHILTVHEQGAVHAADGYARASGRVGVCIATSGPGAANLVTGLATAYLDSSPVVAITGQVSTSLLGRDAFQEIDITGITMPVTKHNFLVKDAESLAEILNTAFSIAKSGRPGPVLVDVPRDVLLAEIVDSEIEREMSYRFTLPEGDDEAISSAANALVNAERPVMIVGGGVKSGCACREAVSLAQQLGIPVVSTLMGLGVFTQEYQAYYGLTGMHGHKAANLAVAKADVVLALGTRFSDRVTGNPQQYSQGKCVIHLDLDRSEFGKNVAADIVVAGDLKKSIRKLGRMIGTMSNKTNGEWLGRIENWRQSNTEEDLAETLHPSWILRCMTELANQKAVTWVTDVGQHQMWAAQHLAVSEASAWLTSGGLGTMGFGLPAAIGAQAACSERRIVVIAGDGGFKMTGMELYTAVNERLPIICVIFNNRALGMVRQWQKLFFDSRFKSTDLAAFDFSGFAAVCGADAYSAKSADEFKTAFSAALSNARTSLIVVDIDNALLVKPMVYPGQSVDRFVE